MIGRFSLSHVYASPGTYQVHVQYVDGVSPLAASIVIAEESLEGLQLVGPTDGRLVYQVS